MPHLDPEKQQLQHERYQLLQQLTDWLETPMLVLGFGWLLLLGVELLWGLTPALELVGTVIWMIFILDFLLKFILAPHKLSFLKQNIITLISLLVPALRLFRLARVFRAARAVRSLRLVKVVGSLNRGMKALSASFGRRGVGYVLGLTGVVLLLGAAGMYAFEKDAPDGLRTYPEALWWTAMLLISMGSDYWPRTGEGQVLCFLLALCGVWLFHSYAGHVLHGSRRRESAGGSSRSGGCRSPTRGSTAAARRAPANALVGQPGGLTKA